MEEENWEARDWDRRMGGHCEELRESSSEWWGSLQVNTPAAEVLYMVIQDWAQLDMGSTVLDVCCGTGTIGLALAQVSQPTIRALPPPKY